MLLVRIPVCGEFVLFKDPSHSIRVLAFYVYYLAFSLIPTSNSVDIRVYLDHILELL